MQIFREKIFIIQPILNDNFRVLHDESVDLIKSADADYCGSSYQTIREVNPATFIGSGKLEEIRQTLDGLDDITVLFNGDLSPSQTLNISAALDDRKVIDRTTLILDIFARNAKSSEGKIQVELAQLKYIYPRLKGKGAALSRLGGGIGSRGPGETQLETDRRHIRYRIKYLEKRLSETKTRRSLQSNRRSKENRKIISLVGYTNTGKSTLLNVLTGADVLAKNELFATLDPTSRKLEIDGAEFLLTDTVGFIQALPHDIVDAFQSTLESALDCDLALFVASATDDYEMQFRVTSSTLDALGFHGKFIKVLNKCDQIADISLLPSDCVTVSAKTGLGLDRLKSEIMKCFAEELIRCKLSVPYSRFSAYSNVRKHVAETSRRYTDGGMEIEASVGSAYLDLIAEFIV